MKKYNKLVRDKVPDTIEKKGQDCRWHYASDEEYEQKLYDKLVEEAKEFAASKSLEEFADVMEVIDAIKKYTLWANRDIQPIRYKKIRSHGGFNNRIILDEL